MAGIEQSGGKGGSKIDFANQPEVEAQADEKKALHPKALSWFFSFRKASQAQTEAQSDDSKIITPLSLSFFWAIVQRSAASFLNLFLGQADQAGTSRKILVRGSQSNIDLELEAKGTGKVKLLGASYVLTKNKILIVDLLGNLLAEYEIEDEFTAVPPTLSSAGTPGQKAWDGNFLYYCVNNNPFIWIKILSIGPDLDFMEVIVAVPAAFNSPGQPLEVAYDIAAGRRYEYTGTQWIYVNMVTNF